MAAAWRSKWLDWQPGDQNIFAGAETPLTKLTKLNSVSFVSAYLVAPQIISAPEPDLLDDLRQPFVAWFDSSMRLDPRWSTSEHALYAGFCAWMFERDLAPPTSGQFRRLLEELCFEIRAVGGELLVPNVAFKEDVAAQRREP